jgi:ribosomal protein L13E
MSTSDKKKAKPGKKAPARKTKAKVTKTKKVAKPAAVVVKPKKIEKVEKVAKVAKPKKVEKKEAPAKVAVKVERVELGPAPAAVVSARHIDSSQERPGRGFSFGELASAGVPLNAAKREGLSVDVRRRSVLEGNVAALKGWFKSPKAAPAK